MSLDAFAGMKAYEMNDRQLVMEPAIRWAGNPNIVLAVKLMSTKIRIQVRTDLDARIVRIQFVLRRNLPENRFLPFSLWMFKYSLIQGYT